MRFGVVVAALLDCLAISFDCRFVVAHTNVVQPHMIVGFGIDSPRLLYRNLVSVKR